MLDYVNEQKQRKSGQSDTTLAVVAHLLLWDAFVYACIHIRRERFDPLRALRLGQNQSVGFCIGPLIKGITSRIKH